MTDWPSGMDHKSKHAGYYTGKAKNKDLSVI